MNRDLQRPDDTRGKGSANLRHRSTPEPIYSGADDQAGEPLLGIVQNEKMVYVNDIAIPVIEDSLNVRDLLERAGFAPTEYTLRLSAAEKPKEKLLGEGQKVVIENNMRPTAVLKPR